MVRQLLYIGPDADKQELDQPPSKVMALTQRLEIRQSHALVMTPQLMQAIKLLQLSNLDLAAYVEGELERNPLLERAGEGEGDRRAEADRGARSVAAGGGSSAQRRLRTRAAAEAVVARPRTGLRP